MSDVTQVLERVHHGDPRAAEELLPLVYDELRKLAAQKLALEAPGHTLQPTQTYGEVCVILGDGSAVRRLTDNQFEDGSVAFIPTSSP